MSLSRFFNDSFFRSPSIFSNEFHNLFSDLERVAATGSFANPASLSSFTPRVKLVEEEKEYYVEAEVAGFPKDSLVIEFPDVQVLRLSGNYQQETKNEPNAETSKSPGSNPTEKSDSNSLTANEASKQVTARSPRVWHNERISKSFTRSIGLPAPVDTTAVKASIKDGILSIVLPKLEEKAHSHRKIEITESA